MAISLIQFAAQADTVKRQGLVEKITAIAVFMRRLFFIPVDGFSYEYNRRDTLGGIAFRGLNQDYTDDVGVINPQIERLAILGGGVRTDYQIANKQGDRVRAAAIAGKVKKTGLQYDRYVFQGDPAVTAQSFFGLNSRLVGHQQLVAGASTTYGTDGNGASLTLPLLDLALDQTVGGSNEGKLICCSKYIRRQITSLARPLNLGGVITDPATGKQVETYAGVPIEVFDEDAYETPILDRNETQGTSTACSSLYTMRLGGEDDGEHVQGLIGGQLIDHLMTGLLGTYYRDIIEANCGLAVFHPRAATRLKGLL